MIKYKETRNIVFDSDAILNDISVFLQNDLGISFDITFDVFNYDNTDFSIDIRPSGEKSYTIFDKELNFFNETLSQLKNCCHLISNLDFIKEVGLVIHHENKEGEFITMEVNNIPFEKIPHETHFISINFTTYFPCKIS
jgi:hypothetical protein